MKYVVYILAAALILWAVGYLIYRFHQTLKGKRGCDCGGCSSCPNGSSCCHSKK